MTQNAKGEHLLRVKIRSVEIDAEARIDYSQSKLLCQFSDTEKDSRLAY